MSRTLSRRREALSPLGCWLVYLFLLGGCLLLGFAFFLTATQPPAAEWVLAGVGLVLVAGGLFVWQLKNLVIQFLSLVLPQADTTPALRVDEAEFHTRVTALEHHPALEVRYPGALFLREFHTSPRRREEAEGPGGRSMYKGAAFLERYFGFKAPVPAEHTPQTILAWYREQLEAQGWEEVEPDPTLTRTLKGLLCMRQADYRLDVSVFERFSMLFADTRTYPMLFKVSLRTAYNMLWGWEE